MGGDNITKLDQTQMKEIKGGALTGSLLSGISSIVKNVTGFFTDLGDMIGLDIFANKNLSGHDKASFKNHDGEFSYDDSASHKAYYESLTPTINTISLV